MERFAADYYWDTIPRLMRPGEWWRIERSGESGRVVIPGYQVEYVAASSPGWVVRFTNDRYTMPSHIKHELILCRLSDSEVVALKMTGDIIEIE